MNYLTGDPLFLNKSTLFNTKLTTADIQTTMLLEACGDWRGSSPTVMNVSLLLVESGLGNLTNGEAATGGNQMIKSRVGLVGI